MSSSLQPSTFHWDLIDQGSNPFEATSLPESIAAGTGHFRIGWKRLVGGLREGLHVLTIDTGAVSVDLLPERGMGIWKCWSEGIEFGWQSPIHGPVHPRHVPIYDPSGIGWLDGFDELLVRCGLESNGAPEFDERGILKYPLHGRIANLPTYKLTIEVDPLAGTLDVRGWVDESRFLIRGLSLVAHYQFKVNQSIISITDTVTNLSAKPTTIQMLYHINVGQPILESGASILAPIKQLCPRNEHSAADLATWSIYKPPTPGYSEQVYFSQLYADSQGWSTAMLCDSQKRRGMAVKFDTKTLPYMTVWKNTAAVEDGYVTGIEPATGFPNARGFEESQGRLVALASGESRRFRLQLETTCNSSRVEELANEIGRLQSQPADIRKQPDRLWAS